MAEHLSIGKQGEEIARDFLLKKGFKILETNWRNGKHEIDIVARDGDLLVIVEVKTRQSAAVAEPEFAVDKQKQRLLIFAANSYIQKNRVSLETRFDIIAIVLNNEHTQVNHIVDAFYPTLR